MVRIFPGEHGGNAGIDQSTERVLTAVAILAVAALIAPRLALAGMPMVRRPVMGRPLAFRWPRIDVGYTKTGCQQANQDSDSILHGQDSRADRQSAAALCPVLLRGLPYRPAKTPLVAGRITITWCPRGPTQTAIQRMTVWPGSHHGWISLPLEMAMQDHRGDQVGCPITALGRDMHAGERCLGINARLAQDLGTLAQHQHGFAVAEQVADKAQCLPVAHQRVDCRLTARAYHGVEYSRGRRVVGGVGLHVAPGPGNLAQPRADQPHHRTLCDQRLGNVPHGGAIHAILTDDGYLARTDARLTGKGPQREKVGFFHLRLEYLVGGRRHGRWQLGDAELLRYRKRQLVGDVAQHRHGTLPHRRHRDLAQLEGKGIDDVLLLCRGLAVEEQPRLVVMLGELLRLAGQLYPGNGLGERDKSRTPGLERTAASQGIGLVGYPPTVDGLTMQA